MVNILHKYSYRKIIMHTIFWVLMLIAIFTNENFQYGDTIQWQLLSHFVFAFVIFALVSYYHLYYLIPNYFYKKKYFTYVLLLLLGAAVGCTLSLIFREFISCDSDIIPAGWEHKEDTALGYFFHIFFGQFMFILATTFFYVLEELIRLQGVTIKIKEVESQKIASELQALKAQINPHFLFNTLNNIYSHSLDNSPQTPEMILKLSSLMSYILYDCHEEQVPISNELDFIKNYLELEKLRFEDTLEVNLSIMENSPGSTIAPLLLIPFIENAFKHGGCNSYGKSKRFVDVVIDIQKENIFFSCKNSVDSAAFTKSAIKESGIGIENVKKRLDLLYPNAYNLSIEQMEDIYTVKLIITEHGN